jgi:hypothetical protein
MITGTSAKKSEKSLWYNCYYHFANSGYCFISPIAKYVIEKRKSCDGEVIPQLGSIVRGNLQVKKLSI